MSLQNFKNSTMVAAFGAEALARRANGDCIKCGENALDKCYSDAGRREVRISGICEPCFDELFACAEDTD